MKTVEEIYAELLAAFQERTGYEAGDSCDLTVRLYAAAAQLQALSIQADWVLNQSFPQTAEGTYLDYHAQARGLSRTAAVKAEGMLRFSVKDAPVTDLTVESGTVCMTADETRFVTTAAAVLKAGSTWTEAPAQAAEAGTEGNAVAGTVTILTACPVGITACTNPSAFSGGCGAESDAALRARILESYQRLPNGANAAYYETAAMAHGGVAAAQAVGRARGIGTVDVYVTAEGGVPDAALLAEVQDDLQQKREIAVDVKALAPTVKEVAVSASLAVADGTEFTAVQTAAEAAVRGYFTGKLLGKPVLTAELGRLLFAVDGVKNYHLLAPAADMDRASGQLPVLGTLTISQLEEA